MRRVAQREGRSRRWSTDRPRPQPGATVAPALRLPQPRAPQRRRRRRRSRGSCSASPEVYAETAPRSSCLTRDGLTAGRRPPARAPGESVLRRLYVGASQPLARLGGMNGALAPLTSGGAPSTRAARDETWAPALPVSAPPRASPGCSQSASIESTCTAPNASSQTNSRPPSAHMPVGAAGPEYSLAPRRGSAAASNDSGSLS